MSRPTFTVSSSCPCPRCTIKRVAIGISADPVEVAPDEAVTDLIKVVELLGDLFCEFVAMLPPNMRAGTVALLEPSIEHYAAGRHITRAGGLH